MMWLDPPITQALAVGEPVPLFLLTRDVLCQQVLQFCMRTDVAAFIAVVRVEAEYGLSEFFCEIHGTHLDSLTSSGDRSACIDCRMYVSGKDRCTGCDSFFRFGQVSRGACGMPKCHGHRYAAPTVTSVAMTSVLIAGY